MGAIETVMITGAAGQDARLLVERLRCRQVNIVCCSKNPQETKKLYNIFTQDIAHEQLDISNTNKLVELVQKYKPNRLFNLAGLSSVVNSYSIPENYLDINGYAVEKILNGLHTKNLLSTTRFYQAASSEIFDPSENQSRNESSEKNPISPYGLSKLYGFEVCKTFREKYGYFITSGILFNHESEYRTEEFLFGKVTNSMARVTLGLQKNFSVENLFSQRDWGYARDYVRAMDLMSSSEIPTDYVVATGQLHSVKEVIDIASSVCNLSEPISNFVLTPDLEVRQNDHKNLYGDSTKICSELGWKPDFNFESMVLQIQKVVLQKTIRENQFDD
jgi:GDPmannose 4,6-dehydratase